MSKPIGGAAFIAAASILIFVLLGRGMIKASAPTFDEPVHLASGYSCLIKGSPCLGFQGHPPFAKKWAALPLLFLNPETFFDHPNWIGGREYSYGDMFLYNNKISAESLLNSARLWCLLTWAALLGVAILEWSRRLAGAPGMIAGGLLLAFCPPLISNAALVTTDAASAVFFFMTFWLLSMRPRPRRLWVLAGAALGLALASKFNMLVLPVFAAACLRLEGKLEKPVILLGAAVLFVLAACYGFVGLRQYWIGIKYVWELMDGHRASFLFGAHSTSGHWLYFPAAIAIKTPLPLLISAALGLFLLLKRRLELIWVVLPALAYFAAAAISKTQIGYRHILPVYPFMIVWGAVGAGWAWKRSRTAVVLAGIWLGAGVLRVYPDYLAYFNETVGGPTQGYRCLLDSNLDWGQGLKELSAELKRRGNPVVVLSYFGSGDPSYYGMRWIGLYGVTMSDRLNARRPEPERLEPVLLAVSATNLQGLYFENRDAFRWLKEREPAFIAGHSIFLYDLSADKEGAALLARLLLDNGYARLGRKLLSAAR